MKTLTRYILINFLRNYMISLFVLIGLYIVLDMVFNFDEFAVTRENTGGAVSMLANMGEYYFFQSFRIFAQLSGVIPVVAAAFTFLRFSRFNELTAMMAAGLDLRVVAMPVIVCAIILSLALPAVNQEVIIPNIIPELTRARNDSNESRGKTFAIQNMLDTNHSLLFVGRYNPPGANAPARMEEVDIVQLDDPFKLTGHITAKSAEFNDATQSWKLIDGQHVTGLGPGERRSQPQPQDEYKSSITPEEIALYRSRDFVELLSTTRINELLAGQQLYGTADLLRAKHARLAQLPLNIIMVLLAISCVLIREPGQLKTAVVKCLILVGSCMATIFICLSIAGQPPSDPAWADRWPAMMAWIPIFVYGPLGVWLLDRVKT